MWHVGKRFSYACRLKAISQRNTFIYKLKLKVNYLQYYRRCKSITEDETLVEYYTIRPTNEASFNISSVIYLKCLKIFLVNAHKYCQPLSKRRLESARKNVQITLQSTETMTRVHYTVTYRHNDFEWIFIHPNGRLVFLNHPDLGKRTY